MWRSVQISTGLLLAILVSSCGGTSVATTGPTTQPGATAAPSARASAVPLPVVVATPAPLASATPKPSASHPSTGPKPSASPDVATIIGSYSAYFTASVRLLNAADDDLVVIVAYVDSSSPKPQPIGTYTLGPSSQQSGALPPGTYRLEFRQGAGTTTGSSCTITVKDGSSYTFIAIPGAIAVSRAGSSPTRSAELFVPASSLCRK